MWGQGVTLKGSPGRRARAQSIPSAGGMSAEEGAAGAPAVEEAPGGPGCEHQGSAQVTQRGAEGLRPRERLQQARTGTASQARGQDTVVGR